MRDRSAEVLDVIVTEARRRRCVLGLVDTSAASRAASVGPDGTVLRLAGGRNVTLGLQGRHQVGNALLALRVVETLAQRDHWQLDGDAVRGRIAAETAARPFRTPRVARPFVVLDGAHNPIKLAAVVSTLWVLYPRRRFPWVLALKQDKDVQGVLDVIAPVASAVAATKFHTTGLDHAAGVSVPAVEIADLARRTGLPAVAEPRPLVALERATERSTGQNPVVVAGSFHLLAALGEFAAAPWQAE